MKYVGTIEAMLLTVDNVDEVASWCGVTPNVGYPYLNRIGDIPYFKLWSNEDQIEAARVGDYIVAPTLAKPRFHVMNEWEFTSGGWAARGEQPFISDGEVWVDVPDTADYPAAASGDAHEELVHYDKCDRTLGCTCGTRTTIGGDHE